MGRLRGQQSASEVRAHQHSDWADGSSTADASHWGEDHTLGAIAPALHGVSTEEVPVAEPAPWSPGRVSTVTTPSTMV